MPLLTVISTDGALTGNSLALLCSSTLKLFTAAEEGFLLYGTEPALEISIKMHAPLCLWPRHYFPQCSPQSKIRCISPLGQKKVGKATKLTELSRTQAGQEIRVRSGRQKCFEETASLVFTPNLSCTFLERISGERRCRKVFCLTYWESHFMN